MEHSTEAVAQAHLEAVESGDPVAMAAHYAVDAVLERGGDIHRGRDEIEAYFVTVPDRLGSASVVFDSLRVDGSLATFAWHLEGAAAPVAGVDTCRIVAGQIVHQVVRLQTTDF